MNKKTLLFNKKRTTSLGIIICLALFVTAIHGCKPSNESFPSEKEVKQKSKHSI